jgi:hypothetical protein
MSKGMLPAQRAAAEHKHMRENLMYSYSTPFVQTITSSNFLAGFGTGAAVTLLLTNPAVQRALFRTVARTTNMITAGFAEAKERFHDAQAEIHHEVAQEPEAS